MRMKRNGKVGRTRREKEQDLAEIASLHAQGLTITEMSEKLKMARSTVHKDLLLLEDRWKKDGMMDIQRIRMKEFREILKAKMEAWDAWKASKKPEEEVTKEESSQGGDGIRRKESKKTKKTPGNPNFLRLVKELISLEADLIGTKVPRIIESDEDNAAAILSGGVIKIPAFSKPLPPPVPPKKP